MSGAHRRLRLDASPAASSRPRDGNAAAYRAAADPRAQEENRIRHVAASLIDPSRFQQRQTFDPERIAQLAESIKPDASGLVHAPVVRPVEGGRFEIVAGEMRVRAMRHNGMNVIPVFVRELDDAAAQIAGFTENALRTNLSAWEEAQDYLALRTYVRGREDGRRNAGGKEIEQLPGVRFKERTIQEILRIGDKIPREMLIAAGAGAPEGTGLDYHVLPKLTREIMKEVCAVRDDQARLAKLRDIVASIRAADAAAEHAPQTPRSPRSSDRDASRASKRLGARKLSSPSFAHLLGGGGFHKQIGAPIGTMEPEVAERHLRDLAPVVAALLQRAAEVGGGALPWRFAVEGGPTLVVSLVAAEVAPGV